MTADIFIIVIYYTNQTKKLIYVEILTEYEVYVGDLHSYLL